VEKDTIDEKMKQILEGKKAELEQVEVLEGVDSTIDLELNGTENKSDPEGLGGWLIYILLGLGYQVIKLSLYLAYSINFFNTSSWSKLKNLMPFSLVRITIIYEFSYNTLLLFISIVAILLYFRKKRIFPKVMIISYIAGLLFITIDYFLVAKLRATHGIMSSSANILRTLIISSIWIPYFIVSKRVKNTFVK
jgi:hypothetical protein